MRRRAAGPGRAGGPRADAGSGAGRASHGRAAVPGSRGDPRGVRVPEPGRVQGGAGVSNPAGVPGPGMGSQSRTEVPRARSGSQSRTRLPGRTGVLRTEAGVRRAGLGSQSRLGVPGPDGGAQLGRGLESGLGPRAGRGSWGRTEVPGDRGLRKGRGPRPGGGSQGRIGVLGRAGVSGPDWGPRRQGSPRGRDPGSRTEVPSWVCSTSERGAAGSLARGVGRRPERQVGTGRGAGPTCRQAPGAVSASGWLRGLSAPAGTPRGSAGDAPAARGPGHPAGGDTASVPAPSLGWLARAVCRPKAALGGPSHEIPDILGSGRLSLSFTLRRRPYLHRVTGSRCLTEE